MDLQKIEERGPLVFPWLEKIAVEKESSGGTKPRSRSSCDCVVLECSPPLSNLPNGVSCSLIIDDSDDVHRFLLDSCLKTMSSGEIATFSLRTHHFRNIIGDHSPDSSIEFTVTLELLAVNRKPSVGRRSTEDLLEEVRDLKSRGVALYARKRFYLALRRFSEALQLTVILQSLTLSESEAAEVTGTKAQLYSNLALLFLNAGGKDEWALKLTERGLALEPENVKLLYRHGWALTRLQNFDLACVEFSRVLELDPGNHSALEKLRFIKEQKKVDDGKMANAMKKLFCSSNPGHS